MKSFKQHITEDSSVTNITKGKKKKWFDVPTSKLGKNDDISQDIFDLITKTYASIGGYVDFKSPDDLPSDFTNWIINDVDTDDDVDIVRFGKKGPGGNKMAGSASDGSPAAKKIMLNKTAKLLNTKGNYGEMSDAMAHVMITRHSVPFVGDEKIVRKLLPGKDIEWVGKHPDGKYPKHDGWYYRKLTGVAGRKLKIMLGSPR